MSTPENQARAIFLEAIERTDAAAREAFIAQACVGDADLQSRVGRLLSSHEQLGSFHEQPPSPEATTDQPGQRLGTQIGPYKLLEQIGEGGFGVVYMAEQLAPVRRKVALKVIKPGMDTRQVIARFEAERQALALMDHPNIAKVLDAGTVEEGVRGQGSGVRGAETSNLTPDSRLLTPGYGRPFFVMELVRGIPITQYCDENSLPIRERLELFATVCRAIQHAHTKGIIHRDIKPTNVLITQQDGQPLVKVIDFGIAKAMGQQLTEKTLFTEFAQMIGTPLYMSPEQAAMSSVDIDTRSDIYSLGVLLYELLTGSTPISKEQLKQANFDEIRRLIREDEAQKPSVRIGGSATLPAIAAHRHVEPGHLRLLVRGELDWIVMKCLDKDRNRRYETAGSLGRDVERYLRDEPVQACPPSTWYRFGKFARRNRREVLIAGAAAVVGVAGVAGLAVSRALIGQALSSAKEAKNELAQHLTEEQRETYFQRITGAYRELSVDNLRGALDLLKACPKDLRGWEWRYLMRLCRVQELVISDDMEINGLAFSPDGDRIACACGDGTIKIRNSRTGDVVQKLKDAHSDAVVAVAFHPTTEHLASVGVDRLVKVWDLTTAQVLFDEPCDVVRRTGSAHTVAFSPDGQKLAVASRGAVTIWDWNDRQIRPVTLPPHKFHSIPVAFSNDGRLATAEGERGLLRLWDTKTGRPLGTIPEHVGPFSALAFSRDGRLLASASYDRSVRLSNSTTGELLSLGSHSGNVECVAISPDGKLLASGGEDKTVRVWDTTTGRELRELLGLRGHTGRCCCVAFSPDGLRLASASSDRTIRLWDATPLRGDECQEILNFDKHSDEIRTLAVSPDGRWVASAGNDGIGRVWDIETGRKSIPFRLQSIVIFCVAWHPDGQRIASVVSDGQQRTVKVWDSSTGQEDDDFELPAEGWDTLYNAVAFSPDGRHLVTGNGKGAVQVWDAKTGNPIGTLGTQTVRGLVFSLDGRYLASSSEGSVMLWDATRLEAARLDQKQEPRKFSARVPGPSLNAAFSPDGRRLATGGEKNTVNIWDIESRGEPQVLRGEHSGEVYAVAFSPIDDGRLIATAGEDSAVKIWDSHTGQLIHSFRGHEGLVCCLAFSPDGRRLVSGSRDKTVKVWDMTQLDGFVNRPDGLEIRPTTTTD
ncbi:MAG: protein kinase [Planctomycetaceae bacterium]|nr:protein kinase [Planctomycetaceae bacterium]